MSRIVTTPLTVNGQRLTLRPQKCSASKFSLRTCCELTGWSN